MADRLDRVFLVRQRHSVEARRGIATKVAELIGGRETIIVDASTTVLEALSTVGDKSNLTVVIDFQDLRWQHRRVVLPDLDGRHLQVGVPVLSGGACWRLYTGIMWVLPC